MPRRDGTGPMGAGPMSGRAFGFCAGYSTPGYMNQMPGHGFGMGFGRERGWFQGGRHLWDGGRRNRLPATAYQPNPDYQQPEITPEDEKRYLENEMKHLEAETAGVKKRINELKSK